MQVWTFSDTLKGAIKPEGIVNVSKVWLHAVIIIIEDQMEGNVKIQPLSTQSIILADTLSFIVGRLSDISWAKACV